MFILIPGSSTGATPPGERDRLVRQVRLKSLRDVRYWGREEGVSGGLTDERREVDGRWRGSDATGRLRRWGLGPRVNIRGPGGSVDSADVLRVVHPVGTHGPG